MIMRSCNMVKYKQQWVRYQNHRIHSRLLVWGWKMWLSLSLIHFMLESLLPSSQHGCFTKHWQYLAMSVSGVAIRCVLVQEAQQEQTVKWLWTFGLCSALFTQSQTSIKATGSSRVLRWLVGQYIVHHGLKQCTCRFPAFFGICFY